MVNIQGSVFEIRLEYVSETNSVKKDFKFRRKLTHAKFHFGLTTRLDMFLEEMNHFIDYLNNCPTIDELHLEYALIDRCMFHVIKNRRLIDGDLGSYADTLLYIYEIFKEDKIDYVEGFNLRSTIIRNVLPKFDKYLFISKFVAPDRPWELIKYDPSKNDVGVLLGI